MGGWEVLQGSDSPPRGTSPEVGQMPCTLHWFLGLGFRVSGLVFGVWGLGLRA